MRAATLVAPGSIRIERVPRPSPGPGEVRIRIEGCGVCASNLLPWAGSEWITYPGEPGGLGHESWGRIDAVGPGVEELARSGIAAGQTGAIIGIGFLGAVLTRLASDAGARVIAIARRPCALELARRQGASELVAMGDHWRIVEAVKALTSDALCHRAIESTGHQWPLDLAGDLVGFGGRLIVAGYHQDGPRQVNMQMWNWKGIDVINAHERDPAVILQGLQEAVEAVATRRLDPRPLCTHRYPLERLGEALDATRDRPEGFIKALVMMR
jgi:threonine dehydrogenase-like Zn-dependent dehydrogenase